MAPILKLVDTSYVLESFNVLNYLIMKGEVPILSSTIIEEIDYNKDHADVKTRSNSRALLRIMGEKKPEEVITLPSGVVAKGADKIVRFELSGAHVYLINSKRMAGTRNNDDKIRKIAKEYDLVLLTRDNGMLVKAEMDGGKVQYGNISPDDFQLAAEWTKNQANLSSKASSTGKSYTGEKGIPYAKDASCTLGPDQAKRPNNESASDASGPIGAEENSSSNQGNEKAPIKISSIKSDRSSRRFDARTAGKFVAGSAVVGLYVWNAIRKL